MDTVKNKPANKKPQILVLFGSPHQNGTTARLLHAFLQPLQDFCTVEILRAFDHPVAPCTGCLYCEHKTGCSQKDFALLEQKVRTAQVIVTATPVYFLSYPAPLKEIVDRFQSFWSMRFVHGKRPVYVPRKQGVLLATAGSQDERCQDILLQQSRMIYSVVDTDLSQAVFWMGTDQKESKEEFVMQKARDAGKIIATSLKA